MRVEHAHHTGHAGKAAVHVPLNNLGEGTKKYNNPKGGEGVVRGLTRLVQDYSVGPLQGGGVETIGAEWKE